MRMYSCWGQCGPVAREAMVEGKAFGLLHKWKALTGAWHCPALSTEARGVSYDDLHSSVCWLLLYLDLIFSVLSLVLTFSSFLLAHMLSLSFSFSFPCDDFLAPASGESWDRLRLTCSQPFTRHQSFGLAFLRVCSSLDSLDEPVVGPSALVSSGLSQVCMTVAHGLNIFPPFSVSG